VHNAHLFRGEEKLQQDSRYHNETRGAEYAERLDQIVSWTAINLDPCIFQRGVMSVEDSGNILGCAR
jgi:hypothetical protein